MANLIKKKPMHQTFVFLVAIFSLQITTIISVLNFPNLLVNFGKFDEKNRSQPRKVQKISMSKNGVKSALRPLFKEL